MERVISISPEELRAWQWSSPQDRLRQANAAFRLFHALHRPFMKPFVRGFDSIQDFLAFEREDGIHR